jgi:hypothetical protein
MAERAEVWRFRMYMGDETMITTIIRGLIIITRPYN